MRLQEVWRRYVNAVACIFLSSCRILCDFCLICAHLFRVSFCNSSLWEAGSWEGKIMIDALSHTLLHWDCLLDLYPSQTEQKKKKRNKLSLRIHNHTQYACRCPSCVSWWTDPWQSSTAGVPVGVGGPLHQQSHQTHPITRFCWYPNALNFTGAHQAGSVFPRRKKKKKNTTNKSIKVASVFLLLLQKCLTVVIYVVLILYPIH